MFVGGFTWLRLVDAAGLSQVRLSHCRRSVVHIAVNWPWVCIFIYTTSSWTFSASRSSQFRQVATISTSTARRVARRWYLLVFLYYASCFV